MKIISLAAALGALSLVGCETVPADTAAAVEAPVAESAAAPGDAPADACAAGSSGCETGGGPGSIEPSAGAVTD